LPGARKDAERSFPRAAPDYETSTTNVSLDLIALYKALVGRWEEAFPDAPAAAEPPGFYPF